MTSLSQSLQEINETDFFINKSAHKSKGLELTSSQSLHIKMTQNYCFTFTLTEGMI